MKFKIILDIVIAAMLVPSLSAALAVDSSLNINGSFTTGTDSLFEARMSNYQSTINKISVLTIADANVSNIKEARFLDKSGWVILTPYQSGSDVLARFISDTGFDINNQRVITLRVNFNTPRSYIIGFSLTDLNGRTLSSAAAPMTVTGAAILGQSTSVTFTRSLRVGLRGADVTALQIKLTAEGFYTGPITGYFGAQTRAGVQQYQTAHGIQANGVIGPQTLAALNQ